MRRSWGPLPPPRGAPRAAPLGMFTKPIATEGDVRRLLGELDPLATSRILAIAPSVDELDEAIRATEDEAGFAEEPRTPSDSTRRPLVLKRP